MTQAEITFPGIPAEEPKAEKPAKKKGGAK